MIELEHVGIAVRDSGAATALMKALLGEAPYKSEIVQSEGVRTHFIRAGGVKLELLEALDESSPIARHLEKRGPGVHHLAFEVVDLEAALSRLAGAGFTPLGDIRDGADGKRIFFIHPRDTGGVLHEFCSQSRSVLIDDVVTAGGEELDVRRAGTTGPVALVAPGDYVDVERLARRLEPDARVIVTDEFASVLPALHQGDDVHVILPAHLLDASRQMPPQVRSLALFVLDDAGIAPTDRPALLAAPPSVAASAAALHDRWPGSELAVGDDELLSIAVERYVRRMSGGAKSVE